VEGYEIKRGTGAEALQAVELRPPACKPSLRRSPYRIRSDVVLTRGTLRRSRVPIEHRPPPKTNRFAGIVSSGARRDRTVDLLLAKQALSQLSYGPVALILRAKPFTPAPTAGGSRRLARDPGSC
jgi:hypothetical protein